MEYQKINLIDNKIADAVAESFDSRITKSFKNLRQNNSETVTNENYKEIPKERQTIIDNLDINIIA